MCDIGPVGCYFHWDVMMSQLLTDQVILVMKQCSGGTALGLQITSPQLYLGGKTYHCKPTRHISLASIPQERRDGRKHILQSELGFAKIVLSVALMWFIGDTYTSGTLYQPYFTVFMRLNTTETVKQHHSQGFGSHSSSDRELGHIVAR